MAASSTSPCVALPATKAQTVYPAGIAYNDTAPQIAADDDLRFLHDQTRRYMTSRAWERLGSASFYLDLKVGSWYEACAQAFSNGPMNTLFLFPGRRDLRTLQQAGMAEPPPGTIFAELHDPTPGFQVITPDGWLPPERRETRLLALAFAAMTDLAAGGNTSVETEAAGELVMPGGGRGRYRARRAPAHPDADRFVPITGLLREDLYGHEECTVSLMRMPWPEYRGVRERAVIYRAATDPFQDRSELIPLVVLSGSADLATGIAGKLQAAEPLGITFAERDGALAMILPGLKDSYLLMEAGEQREEVLLWWHGTKSSGGAYALMVTDSPPDPPAQWHPLTVLAVFEFGKVR